MLGLPRLSPYHASSTLDSSLHWRSLLGHGAGSCQLASHPYIPLFTAWLRTVCFLFSLWLWGYWVEMSEGSLVGKVFVRGVHSWDVVSSGTLLLHLDIYFSLFSAVLTSCSRMVVVYTYLGRCYVELHWFKKTALLSVVMWLAVILSRGGNKTGRMFGKLLVLET